jgi:hypothetical protein
MAATQMGIMTGFQRLENDIARASHMASPNLRRDWLVNNQRACVPQLDSWPEINIYRSLKNMAGFRVDKNSVVTGATTAMPDGSAPDSIRIVGNLGIAETFYTQAIHAPSEDGSVGACAPNYTILLQERYANGGTGATTPFYGGILRSGLAAATDKNARMLEIFKPGRWIRVLANVTGKTQYSIITAAGFVGGGSNLYYVCTASGLTSLTKVKDNSCGYAGDGVGSQVNPVHVVEYYLGKMTGSEYTNSIYSTTGITNTALLADEAGRNELIRREVLFNSANLTEQDPANSPGELVAEYAVDLRIALRVSPASSGTEYLNTKAQIDKIMAQQSAYNPGDAASGPESIRAVEVRLVVRNMDRDRTVDLTPAAAGVSSASGLVFRYPLAANAYARTRTLTADIALQNQSQD